MKKNFSKVPPSSRDLRRDHWIQAFYASASLWLTVCFFGPLILELTQSPVDLIPFISTLLSIALILTAMTSYFLVRLLPSKLFSFAIVLVVSLGVIAYSRAFLIPDDLVGAINARIIPYHYQNYHFVGLALWSLGLIVGTFFRDFVTRHIKSLTKLFISFQFIFVLFF
jgi:hypothetical protein